LIAQLIPKGVSNAMQKKYSLLYTLLLLLVLLLSGCAPVATPAEPAATTAAPAASEDAPTSQPVHALYNLPDLQGRSVVAVAANDFTPFQYIDPQTGAVVGYEYDLVNELCHRLNCVVDWQTSSWDTMIAAVHNGQFDVGMDGITITDERKEQVDFSAPYKTLQNFMLVRADEERFTTPQEFAADENLLIGSQAGTTQFYAAVYEILDGNEQNPRIKLFDNFGAAVQALISGDVDLVLASAESGAGYIGANPDQLKLVGDPLGNEDIGFIFTPGSDLVDPFNQAIGTMQRDGFLDYLNNRWFYLSDPNTEDIYDKLPDLEGRTVVAVTANDYTPLNFIDPKSGAAVGWEYDAVNEICVRLNCVVDWQTSSWDTMIAAVHDGQFDVGMDGITINDERKQQVDFSDSYLTSQQFMLVRADEERFTTPQEFAANSELLIGSQAGTTSFYTAVYNVLDGDEQNPRIKLFETFGVSVQALLAGDVDMVLVDAASGRGYIGANPDQLQIVGDPLATEEFGFIFTPGSDLVEPFNAAIDSLKQDKYLDYLNVKWFFLYDPTK
jgi:polar amino acid transport system substrate-binding protein